MGAHLCLPVFSISLLPLLMCGFPTTQGWSHTLTRMQLSSLSTSPAGHNHLEVSLRLPYSVWRVTMWVISALVKPLWGLPRWLRDRESSCDVRATGDVGSIPGSGRSPGGGCGNPLQHSCLESPTDRGAWRAAVRHESDMTESLSTHAQPLWEPGLGPLDLSAAQPPTAVQL